MACKVKVLASTIRDWHLRDLANTPYNKDNWISSPAKYTKTAHILRDLDGIHYSVKTRNSTITVLTQASSKTAPTN